MTQRDRRERPLQQDRAVRTRKKILEAAATLFDENGFGGTTIADIVERSEMTKGALYFHFKSKDAVAVAIMEDQFAGLPELPPQSLASQMLVDTGFLLSYLLRTDPMQRGAARLAMEQGSKTLDTKRSNDVWIEVVSSILTEAWNRGELLPSVDIYKVSWHIVAAFSGIQNMSQTYDGRMELTNHLKDMWEFILPSVVVPAVLAKLDLDPDKGEKLSNGLSSSSG
ncbi:ScbR family autoregulator-binding transcription factor [Streptomyces lydicus]|uniref:ScbR family autoregulator-binding transcription factor n=1 Tax=Streptomyces lydicus TaxID=47763 RepID=UPI0013E93095|nr:ScbR family autoregulator-binding transcription factor [Streptomyces lydicus]MCZ1012089.1 ScbR family autoregulator-binding transcription factor [Streptomyces lydicus]